MVALTWTANRQNVPVFGTFDNGGDLVETSFLMQGLLTARQYFHGSNEKERDLYKPHHQALGGSRGDCIARLQTSDFIYWHWSPQWAWADSPSAYWIQ